MKLLIWGKLGRLEGCPRQHHPLWQIFTQQLSISGECGGGRPRPPPPLSDFFHQRTSFSDTFGAGPFRAAPRDSHTNSRAKGAEWVLGGGWVLDPHPPPSQGSIRGGVGVGPDGGGQRWGGGEKSDNFGR